MKLPPFIAATALVMLMFVSCHKDNAKPSDQIIGTWNGNKIYESDYLDGQLVGRDTVLIATPDYVTIEFKTGNTFALNSSVQGSEDHESGYYKLQGSQLLLGGTEDDPNKISYDYQLNGNSLILKYSESDTLNNHIYKTDDQLSFTKQ